MDRDVRKDDEPRMYVVVQVPSIEPVKEWCLNNIPRAFWPQLSVHETTNNEAVVRATFTDMHYAAIFRMFWDNGC